MRILALDLGTLCGYAIGAPGSPIDSGVLDLRPKRYDGAGMRYVAFRGALQRLLVDVDLVVYEEVRRHMGVDASHVYGAMEGHLQFECEQRSIPYRGIPIATIKRRATGHGNADKLAMIAAAQAAWPCRTIKDDNEADALWILQCALDEWGGLVGTGAAAL